jgi:hypothetical protein
MSEGGARTFPAGDRAFAREVERVLQAVAWRSDEASVSAATMALRRLYPNASLRWRDDLGGYAGSVCYAFRDGRIRAQDERRERRYAAIERSRALTADAARILNDAQPPAARPAHKVAGGSRDPVISR